MTAPAVDNRELIDTELDRNLVVEAAAGTGKTTKLVDRVVALIENSRVRIDQIVAVTFTEKAAGELKLRLRQRLERARTEAVSAAGRELLDRAVHDFEEAHITTIHGFCAELLRERPIEARVDPAFQVLSEGAASQLFDEVFLTWLHRSFVKPGEGVRRLLRRKTKPVFGEHEDAGPIQRLNKIARDLLDWRDYAAEWTRPQYDREGRIKELIQQLRAFAEMTAAPIKKGDYFSVDMAPARVVDAEIRRQQKLVGDMVPPSMYDLWESMLIELGTTYKFRTRFRKGTGAAFAIGVTRQEALLAHQQLLEALAGFKRDADADIAALLKHELTPCFESYEVRKQRTGNLDFVDLLTKARDLIRNNRDVRAHLQSKYKTILIDEFQDTDSIQADLLLALAEDEHGVVQQGRLFVVGDPKQSIYRFRRADLGAYQFVIETLEKRGALKVVLNKSFRSLPSLQNFINAAFSTEMNGDEESQQARYVPLARHRDDVPEQPTVVALPIPRPYNFREVTQTQLMNSEPPAVAEFVKWLVSDDCKWTVDAGADGRRRIKPGDICILMRRFVHFEKDVTRPYMEELERRAVPHLLVGGKSFHQREEVEVIRNAVTAIEWPEDELSVYATLQGPLFAIGEHELLEYHSIAKFHPYRIPIDLPDRLRPIAEALTLLRSLHGARNYRPIAHTIETLIASTRAHASFVLWSNGEQVLANVLQVTDLARRYEVEGGLSFRGFVELLRDAQNGAESREAPVLEEGSEGVRIMSVHRAKGLEFPVVILGDVACQLSRADAGRFVDASRNLCALRIGGLSPADLLLHNAQEAKRDEAEGVRVAYVAATRARDLLIVPAVGDGPHDNSWVRPLYHALYPPKDPRHSPSDARGVPLFKGKDTVIPDARPAGQLPDAMTVRPGTYVLGSAPDQFAVTWWDPQELVREPDERKGVRREDLIAKDANPLDVAADRARYDAWRDKRQHAQQAGATASTTLMTATEIIKQAPQAAAVPDVKVEDTGTFIEARPSGKRFGTLVHALLATLPLDADASEVADLAALHAKLFAAQDDERDAAAAMAVSLTKHARWQAARAAAAQGRRVWREVPVSMRMPGEPGDSPTIVDGQVDLAYETDSGWIVIDFKTDIEIASAQDAYKQQVALYADAVAKATGRPATGVLLRV